MSAFRNSDGTFASYDYDSTIPLALAKDKLRRVLTTRADGRGHIPDGAGGVFSNEDQAWALKVMRERPEWALATLNACDC